MHSTQSNHIQRTWQIRTWLYTLHCIVFPWNRNIAPDLGLNAGGFSGGEVVSGLAVDYHVAGTCAMQP
jgi:hypothetical protein